MADGGGLSELGVLVAQLESVVHSASQKPLQPLMCFDLLSDLLSTIDKESKVKLFLEFFQSKFEVLEDRLINFVAHSQPDSL